MSVYCEKCKKIFKNNAGKSSHMRTSKTCGSGQHPNSLQRISIAKKAKTILERPTSYVDNEPQGQPHNPPQKESPIAQDQKQPETIKEPTLDQFSSNWLDDWENGSKAPDKPANSQVQTTDPNITPVISTQPDSPFVLSADQYSQFYAMLNDFMDTIIVLFGGDETFSEMKKTTLENLGNQTKTYADSMNFQLSPGKMLMVSIGLAYSVPAGRAFKSIRTNRKLLAETGMKKGEITDLEKNIKITPSDGDSSL